MAFSGGGSGVQSDINITPLVDVVLVLLIIFMVATPILQMGLDVEVPPKVEMATPPPDTDVEQLVITAKADGFYLNTQRFNDVKGIRDAIAQQMASRKEADRVVFVDAEDNLSFDRAVAAMDAAHEAGAKKVGFLTEKPAQ